MLALTLDVANSTLIGVAALAFIICCAVWLLRRWR